MKIKATIGAAVLAGAVVLAAPVRAAETILFNCFFPPKHYVCSEFLPEMDRRIQAATEGRVKLRVPPKSLTAPPDVYDGVVNGVMDGGLQFNAFLSGQVPGIQFSLLPFVGHLEAEPSSVALWQTYQKFFGDKDEFGKAVLLSVYTSNGAEFFSMTDTPITSVADIASRKMWGLPGTVANVLKESGSAVVAGPAVQMLEIISKGVVDGYTGVPYSSVEQFKLMDYTKSATIFEKKIFQPTFSFFVSREKWDVIAPADQAAILAALGEDYARYAGRVQDGYAAEAEAAVRAAGIKVLDGSPEMLADLQALGQGMVDAWIAKAGEMGVDGAEVLAFYEQAYQAAKAAMK